MRVWSIPDVQFDVLPLDRPPPRPSHCPHEIYEVRRSASQTVFFEDGRPFELGGSAGFLKQIMSVLGVKYHTTFGGEGRFSEYNDAKRTDNAERRARVLAMTVRDLHRTKGWDGDAIREYQSRDYLRLDEINLRGKLAGQHPHYLISECLPLWCERNLTQTDEQARAYTALEQFIWALDRETVTSEVLLEFAFDFQEGEGNGRVRQNWESTWR